MKVEFRRPGGDADVASVVVGTATWDGRNVLVEADDPDVRETIARAFRRTPVVVDDPSARPAGTTGSVLIDPSGLEWFRAVAQVRVPAETGLVPVFVADVLEGGYDPAANYRTFEEQIERLNLRRESTV
jgi:hypothetical protein